jgi:putative ABC transport system ATP-binding protein
MSNSDLLVANNIVKTYGKKESLLTVLHGITLSIRRGESVAILGKSGSGKSTLMHILSGLDGQYEGQVSLDGQKLNGMKDKELDEIRSKKVGFIFQTFYVQPNETVLENVVMPLAIAGVPRGEQLRRGMETLKAVGLEDKAKQKAKNLSGGQKQRVCIARALVNNPSVIFADEPVGNLDSVTGKMIEDQLFVLNKQGVTLVIVTHDEELAGRCARRIEIKDGRIV